MDNHITLNGWHKGYGPQASNVLSGDAALKALNETLALEAERHRIRTQGPASEPKQKELS
jgi:hypothetical protein